MGLKLQSFQMVSLGHLIELSRTAACGICLLYTSGATRSDVVKKWDRESESSWQDEATTGNPGPMFVLKARRGWSEQAPAIGQSENRMLQRTADQILSDYQEPKQLPDKDF